MKVWAKDEQMAKLLRHPVGNVGFLNVETAAHWPDDSFTTRRIADGDVVTEDPKRKSKESSS